MSIAVQSLVWASALAGTEMLVMQALADNADSEGHAYPSVAYLVWKTGLSHRTVQRTLSAFRKQQYIEGDPDGGDQSTHYKILIENLPDKEPWKRLKGREVGRSGREASPSEPAKTQRQHDAPSESNLRQMRPDPVPNTSQPRAIDDTTPRQMRPRNKEESPAIAKKSSRNHQGADAPYQCPDWMPFNEWKQFLAMRQRIRKPATEYAQSLLIRKLSGLRDQGHDPTAVLNQSIVNSWQDVYPLKEEQTNGNRAGGRMSFEERAAEERRIAKEYAQRNPARANGEIAY